MAFFGLPGSLFFVVVIGAVQSAALKKQLTVAKMDRSQGFDYEWFCNDLPLALQRPVGSLFHYAIAADYEHAAGFELQDKAFVGFIAVYRRPAAE